MSTKKPADLGWDDAGALTKLTIHVDEIEDVVWIKYRWGELPYPGSDMLVEEGEGGRDWSDKDLQTAAMSALGIDKPEQILHALSICKMVRE